MDDKITPPTIHRMEGELMLCDPEKTDQTRDVESWRIFKIMAELVDGFQLLRKYRLAATFFGSARTSLDEKIYADAVALSGKLADSGFTIMTGGASGIMEAASRGAYQAGGKSVGLNINLPLEQGVNQYLTDRLAFNYFFTRKVMLAFASEVYIFFPGGFGTLDEFFEILTLVQTGKVKRIPIILYGREYWAPFLELFEKHLLLKYQTISKEDLKLYNVVDSVEEAYEAVLKLVKC
ncbi:MAG TPA: TIGR00730 family Rossman fold protein [Candidatus Paceibacterota bacterium]